MPSCPTKKVAGTGSSQAGLPLRSARSTPRRRSSSAYSGGVRNTMPNAIAMARSTSTQHLVVQVAVMLHRERPAAGLGRHRHQRAAGARQLGQHHLKRLQRGGTVGAPAAAEERHHQWPLGQQVGGVHQSPLGVRQQEGGHRIARFARLGGDLAGVQPLQELVIGGPDLGRLTRPPQRCQEPVQQNRSRSR